MKLPFFIVFYLITASVFAEKKTTAVFYLDNKQNIIFEEVQCINHEMPCPVFHVFRKKHRLNKRITAAVLAFPFPFGIVGLHRIYLGTKPFVPVAYIASLGGGFGILPLIDFFSISFDKDFDHCKDNGKVFMWVKE